MTKRTTRRKGRPHTPTEADAYDVHADEAASLGFTVGGWKLALTGGRAVGVPLWHSTLLPSGAVFDWPDHDELKIETELAFTLKHDIPRERLSRTALIDAIASVHPAFELVCARFGAPPAVPLALFLADYLGNAATVIGPGQPLETLPETGALFRDGIRIAEGRHPAVDPLVPLLDYAAYQPDRLGGLQAGQVIITGSFTGATVVTGNGEFTGEFPGMAPVTVRITQKGHG